jgi:hypothetical protein
MVVVDLKLYQKFGKDRTGLIFQINEEYSANDKKARAEARDSLLNLADDVIHNLGLRYTYINGLMGGSEEKISATVA